MNMKTVRFACSNCGAGLEADARAAGYDVECPQCGEILVVPGGKAPEPAPAGKGRPAPEPPAPSTAPSWTPVDRLQPKVKFCIACSKDVPDGDLTCPHCGGGRFGRL